MFFVSWMTTLKETLTLAEIAVKLIYHRYLKLYFIK